MHLFFLDPFFRLKARQVANRVTPQMYNNRRKGKKRPCLFFTQQEKLKSSFSGGDLFKLYFNSKKMDAIYSVYYYDILPIYLRIFGDFFFISEKTKQKTHQSTKYNITEQIKAFSSA